MKRILLITVCLVMILAGMSVFPGLIHSTIFSFLGFFTLLPLLGLWFFVVGAAAVRDLLRNRSVRSAFGVHAAALSGFVFVLVVLRIPLRLGFAVSRPSFERFILSSDIPDGPQTPTPTRWLGIFHSDRYARDSRGGVFFRTATGSDFIDTMSYGFVFQPNRKGTPFGAAKYTLIRVFGDWHTFYVSDDYY